MKKLSKPELALLAGLALIALSMVVPGFWSLHRSRLGRMAREDLRNLVDAGQRFHTEYGVWFSRSGGEAGDVRYGRDVPNWEFINALRALDGPGNTNHIANPRRIVFLELSAYAPGVSGVDANGEYLDPWGTPYQLIVDADASGVCRMESTIHGTGVDLAMIAWSCGPDRRSDTPDDVLSWTAVHQVLPIGAPPPPAQPEF